MKYAIIQSGGKQFRAVEGGTIEVDRLEAGVGDPVTMDNVLLLADDDQISVGAPAVAGAAIEARVVGHVKGPKIAVFRYKPKKRERVKTGHRQKYTRLLIEAIRVSEDLRD